MFAFTDAWCKNDTKETAYFFQTLVIDSIIFREWEGIIRPDMIHLLMQVQEDDLRDDGSSSGMNPESEIATSQMTLEAQKLVSLLSLVAE